MSRCKRRDRTRCWVEQYQAEQQQWAQRSCMAEPPPQGCSNSAGNVLSPWSLYLPDPQRKDDPSLNEADRIDLSSGLVTELLQGEGASDNVLIVSTLFSASTSPLPENTLGWCLFTLFLNGSAALGVNTRTRLLISRRTFQNTFRQLSLTTSLLQESFDSLPTNVLQLPAWTQYAQAVAQANTIISTPAIKLAQQLIDILSCAVGEPRVSTQVCLQDQLIAFQCAIFQELIPAFTLLLRFLTPTSTDPTLDASIFGLWHRATVNPSTGEAGYPEYISSQYINETYMTQLYWLEGLTIQVLNLLVEAYHYPTAITKRTTPWIQPPGPTFPPQSPQIFLSPQALQIASTIILQVIQLRVAVKTTFLPAELPLNLGYQGWVLDVANNLIWLAEPINFSALFSYEDLLVELASFSANDYQAFRLPNEIEITALQAGRATKFPNLSFAQYYAAIGFDFTGVEGSTTTSLPFWYQASDGSGWGQWDVTTGAQSQAPTLTPATLPPALALLLSQYPPSALPA